MRLSLPLGAALAARPLSHLEKPRLPKSDNGLALSPIVAADPSRFCGPSYVIPIKVQHSTCGPV